MNILADAVKVTLGTKGRNVALVCPLTAVEKLKGDNEDQNVGIGIALRARTEPLRQIVSNAGE